MNSKQQTDAHATPATLATLGTSAGLPRRDLIVGLGAAAVSALGASALAQPTLQPANPARPRGPLTPQQMGWDAAKNEYVLPKLPYAYDALEPHIDKLTMETHHSKHHDAYVKGLNRALSELAKIRDGQADPSMVKHWSRELSFHGGGHINHALFWHMMAPAGKGGGGQPTGTLAQAIDRDFGSFEKFVAHFKAAATQVEASGWAWLIREPYSGRLLVVQMEKQQDMMLTGAQPLLGIDVWEHAYYVKYQNKRADYVNAFMNVVNWRFVQDLFARATA
jgi:Fe-Mn family superoxide dismutase